MSDTEIPFAPWHRPRWKRVGPNVEVLTIYGSHVLAALLYAGWCKLRSAVEEQR